MVEKQWSRVYFPDIYLTTYFHVMPRLNSHGYIPSLPCILHGVNRKTLSLSGLLLDHNNDAFKWRQSATHLSPSANVKNSWIFTSTPPASIPLTSVPPPEVRSLLQIRHASVHPHGVIVQYGRVFVASWWNVAMAAGTGRPSARRSAGWRQHVPWLGICGH